MKALLRLALAGWLVLGVAFASTVDRIAATVNDVAIPESELRRAMAISALKPGTGESLAAFRARVLDALIDERLQYEDALRFGPALPDASEVTEQVRRLRDRLTKSGKNPDAEFAAAGLTAGEVRSMVERQLIIQRYLQERFRPIALADEERAREEYEKVYVPELKVEGKPVPPYDQVSEDMRERSQERVFNQEVEKWARDLREKARISIYRAPVQNSSARTAVAIATAGPAPTPTPVP